LRPSPGESDINISTRASSSNRLAAASSGIVNFIGTTDAPLLPAQLSRLSKRASLGLARNGSIAGDSSGDIFIAFSTANVDAGRGLPDAVIRMVPNGEITPLFEAVVNATEESIINALVAGRTMTGHEGHKIVGINHKRLQEILDSHNRLAD
jgi:D-aminopeptidase